jgi:putative phosphoesterase
MLIGLIADTHGYLDPQVPPALQGVDLILHAGDIGAEDVLAALADVTAVVGNNDGPLAHLGLPLQVDVELEGVRIHLVHRLIDAAPGPDTRVVVYGHSHKALVAEREGMLWVNPGAAGRVGFHREVTLALLRVANGRCEAELVLLGPRVPVARSAPPAERDSRTMSPGLRRGGHGSETSE